VCTGSGALADSYSVADWSVDVFMNRWRWFRGVGILTGEELEMSLQQLSYDYRRIHLIMAATGLPSTDA